MAATTFDAELSKLGPAASAASWSLEASRGYCRQLARTHYENFAVASWLLPADLRQHFCNVYAYCRWSDDLADETPGGPRSLDLLDWWQSQLADCYRGRVRHPVFVALADTIQEFEIPIDPLSDLLCAFRQDQVKHRYHDRQELLDYCKFSANPVGRLVLYLARTRSEQALLLSDSICTGLQLVNFWQDVARDWQRGRRYLPDETMNRFNCSEQAFHDQQATAAFRAALAHEVGRAEEMLQAGRPLVRLVPRNVRLDVWLFIQGGLAIARAIRRCGYDVWSRRPVVTRSQQFLLLARGLWRQKVGPWGAKR